MNKVICIIQARMGSNRLPGKVLKDLCGKPMLEHIVERLKVCKELNEIIVATSNLTIDNPIAKFCEDKQIKLFRGSEDDVLNRYYEATKEFNGDIIVRVTGDCPLIEPSLVDGVIKYFKYNNFDYVSPRSKDRLIRGLDVEVFSRKALEKANKNAKDGASREHVTYYMYSNPKEFKIKGYEFSDQFKDDSIRLCVDEENDFELVNIIYSNLYNNNVIEMKDVLKFLKENKEYSKINNNVKQKLV